ncbi:hypothetical protein K488DRAFT_91855 [Vararia minispora EC-137]|uniref:Uncharacterized protein n=1 Tax=Vararia minispora EC-137 TaxID=1314806 RepID=A0ACB8Q4V0_9AGAM|nr:hypothetical protein K488DRAFT_91855 [Vararia minispora EC-137]
MPVPLNSGKEHAATGIYDSEDHIIVGKQSYFRRLNSVRRFAASLLRREWPGYGFSDLLLGEFSRTIELADGGIATFPQASLKLAEDPSRLDTRALQRTPDFAVLAIEGIPEPTHSCGTVPRARIVLIEEDKPALQRHNSPVLIPGFSCRTILRDYVKQATMQVVIAMSSYDGQLFYTFLNQHDRFSLLRWTRPSDWDTKYVPALAAISTRRTSNNAKNKKRKLLCEERDEKQDCGSLTRSAFDAGDLEYLDIPPELMLQPELLFFYELTLNAGGFEFSDAYRYAIHLIVKHLEKGLRIPVTIQPSWFWTPRCSAVFESMDISDIRSQKLDELQAAVDLIKTDHELSILTRQIIMDDLKEDEDDIPVKKEKKANDKSYYGRKAAPSETDDGETIACRVRSRRSSSASIQPPSLDLIVDEAVVGDEGLEDTPGTLLESGAFGWQSRFLGDKTRAKSFTYPVDDTLYSCSFCTNMHYSVLVPEMLSPMFEGGLPTHTGSKAKRQTQTLYGITPT